MNMEHKFNIGDRVRLKSNALPFIVCRDGEIVDIVTSEKSKITKYHVLINGTEYQLLSYVIELISPTTATYNFEFEYLDNVVVARFYEYKGEEKTELAKGHGHILHDGVIGIAQAASYASKRCYDKLAGNDETKSYYINK